MHSLNLELGLQLTSPSNPPASGSQRTGVTVACVVLLGFPSGCWDLKPMSHLPSLETEFKMGLQGRWDISQMCKEWLVTRHVLSVLQWNQPALCKKSSFCSHLTGTETKALATEDLSYRSVDWSRRGDQVSRLKLQNRVRGKTEGGHGNKDPQCHNFLSSGS